MNWWEALGLPVQLVLAEEEVEKAFQQKSAGAHPDAGGEQGEFECLREAHDGLRDDFRRLDAWLRFHGQEIAHSGVITPAVGEMFTRVSVVTGGIDEWLERQGQTSSGLGKALWQKEGFRWKQQLEDLLEELAEWQQRLQDEFTNAEQAGVVGDYEPALALRSELGFLRKWKLQLKERFGRIWQGLV